jgi:hypothetical protein
VGKSSLAQRLLAVDGIPWLPTDVIRTVVRRMVPEVDAVDRDPVDAAALGEVMYPHIEQAAEVCAERVAGILQHAVEQVLWPDTDVTAAGSEPGGDLQGAFGQEVDTQRVGAGVPAAPPASAADPPLGRLKRSRAKACFQARPYLLDVDAQGPQRRSRLAPAPSGGPRRRNPVRAAARFSPCASSKVAAWLLPVLRAAVATRVWQRQSMEWRAAVLAAEPTAMPRSMSRRLQTGPVNSRSADWLRRVLVWWRNSAQVAYPQAPQS